ncbi:MAG: aspartate-semialdehyde dehydrogenase [Acidobacteriota bacterium]
MTEAAIPPDPSSPSSDARRWTAGILGATGSVGQRFVALLADHPWFDVVHLAASSRSAGRPYADAAHWLGDATLPPAIGALTVHEAHPDSLPAGAAPPDVVFSALGSAQARALEPAWARAGAAVISNASAYRMADDVPLLIPEVNPDHLALIDRQAYGDGFIVTNPNCATVGLVCALAPITRRFGLTTVRVTTLQAVSGAGYPGVASLDILGNVVPWIRGEADKLHTEPQRILGALDGDRVVPASFVSSAQVTRVPVRDGHLLSIDVETERPVDVDAAAEALTTYASPIADLDLPSAPARLVHLAADPDRPQPRLDVDRGRGMTVTVGQLRIDPLGALRLVALVHNTLRGAAGAAVLNAELLARRGRLSKQR